ncbi:hypothetical protein SRABI98_00418 [Microbacterium sp. Bi98]|uniref:hypothetical protein n=1 Tax=unclassified Microbacterium TaxID=2609290 RepID=UPI000AF9DFFE|nr:MULTISPECIES: hypothetical protein [unclassified Microbacterium]CAH0135962.1 hypothetical protein SRABI98_00418 [Microbacterium sp. Bi98]
MRSPLARHVAASALAVVVLIGGISGCASLPGASSPVPTSSAEPAPSATQTGSETPTPTSTPTPTPTSSAEFGEFSGEELAQICVDATLSAFPADVVFSAEKTRIEHRLVSPEWLVLVPAQASGLEAQAQCTIGGSAAAPQLGMSSASLEPLPEEQIQNLIRGENEGGDR